MSTLQMIGAALYVILSVVVVALVLYSVWWTIQDQVSRQREKHEGEETE